MVHGGGKSSSFRGLQQEGKVSEERNVYAVQINNTRSSLYVVIQFLNKLVPPSYIAGAGADFYIIHGAGKRSNIYNTPSSFCFCLLASFSSSSRPILLGRAMATSVPDISSALPLLPTAVRG